LAIQTGLLTGLKDESDLRPKGNPNCDST
ncbi:hypothetical protein Rleg9DRAFT_6679, partial [Rhizobium leguminosarum bv. trifolii WSM597]